MHRGKTGTLTSHIGVFDGITIAHEVGHVLGAQHGNLEGNQEPVMFFARGFQTTSGKL